MIKDLTFSKAVLSHTCEDSQDRAFIIQLCLGEIEGEEKPQLVNLDLLWVFTCLENKKYMYLGNSCVAMAT